MRQLAMGESFVMKAQLGKLLFVAAAGISFLFSVWLWFGGESDLGALGQKITEAVDRRA